MRNVLVWDLPVRLFHWLLTAGFVTVILLAWTLDEDDPSFVFHKIVGVTLGVMVVWRIVWGLVGSHYARFSKFVLAPRALIEYLLGILGKPQKEGPLRHNPASSWVTLAMIACVLNQAVTGIIMGHGNESVSELHELGGYGFLALAIIHVIGVVIHALRYHDGIAMGIVDGRKRGPADAVSVARHGVAALVLLALIGGTVGLLLAGQDGTGRLVVPGPGWTVSEAPEEDHDASEHDGDRHDSDRRHGDRHDSDRHHGDRHDREHRDHH